MLERLIPTFEVGQRVIYHKRQFEFMCPLCGYIANSLEPQEDIITTIVRPATSKLVCRGCDGSYPTPEGWYAITERARNGRNVACPYTLIEAIKEEQDDCGRV